ncbi:MAG: addiction module protein [Planctomycetes bacterium]|nr:addiction module protein [Planctomycetota bacterium]
MTTADKLSAMERLWDDLCRRPEDVPSPIWHRDVLETREKRVRKGKARFFSLDEAKARTRKASR